MNVNGEVKLGGGGAASSRGVRVDVNGLVVFVIFFFLGGGSGGGPIRFGVGERIAKFGVGG